MSHRPLTKTSSLKITAAYCVHVTIMYIVYSITRRSSDWTVLDVWPAQPLCQGAL